MPRLAFTDGSRLAERGGPGAEHPLDVFLSARGLTAGVSWLLDALVTPCASAAARWPRESGALARSEMLGVRPDAPALMEGNCLGVAEIMIFTAFYSVGEATGAAATGVVR